MSFYLDRTEGRAGRKSQPLTPHRSKFVFTTKDGQEIEMLPSQPEEGARAAAVTTSRVGEDAMIPGLERATALVRV